MFHLGGQAERRRGEKGLAVGEPGWPEFVVLANPLSQVLKQAQQIQVTRAASEDQN